MSGRARSIAEVLASCATSDGLYQAVRLQDESYVLIRGGGPVQPGEVLPFEPRNGMQIDSYPTRHELETDWAAAMDDIENSEMMLERRHISTE
jgi:hypothetical protein